MKVAVYLLMMVTIIAARDAAWGASVSIDGDVTFQSTQLPVDGVSMELQGAGPLSAPTDPLGFYSFVSVDLGIWTLQPRKQDAGSTGITAMDAVYALQAAVGLRTLTPEQALACDVSGNGVVSAIDAALILQYVVGLLNRFPVATACGSDWAFIPKSVVTGVNIQSIQPQVQSGACQPGGVVFDPLDGSMQGINFEAVRFGDCTGNWSPPPAPVATASPLATPTVTPSETPSPTRSLTPSQTATPPPTTTPTRTATMSATPSLTPSLTPSATLTPTLSATPSPSRTPTVTPSSSRTPTQTATASATASATPSPTVGVAPLCGATSVLSGQQLIMFHPDVADATGIIQPGRAHILNTVPTSDGWGVFWLRDTTGDTFNVFLPSTLYYAHVAFDGRITAGPMPLLDIHRQDREPLYMVTWRVDHYALLINELINTDVTNKITYQYYYDLSLDGLLSARVGPIRTDLGPSGGIGEIMSYLTGFIVGVETTCQTSHQCDFAFTLGDHGLNKGRDLNIVEFDGTHSHAPNFAYDGSGVVVISSKDADNSNGGIVSQYIYNSGTAITHSTPVIPNHGFLLDNNPDLAWNGSRFAAVWREVQSLTSPLDQNYRMRLATFTRTVSTSTLLTDHFLEPTYVLAQYLGHSFGWTTNISAVSDGWVASFAQGTPNGPQAMLQHLTQDGDLTESWTPFPLDDFALHTSVHFSPAYTKTIGIATSHRTATGVNVTFSTLRLACGP